MLAVSAHHVLLALGCAISIPAIVAQTTGLVYWVPVSDAICPQDRGGNAFGKAVIRMAIKNSAPNILAFLRTTEDAITVDYDVRGFNYLVVVPRRSVTLINLATATINTDYADRRLSSEGDVAMALPSPEQQKHMWSPASDTDYADRRVSSEGSFAMALPSPEQEEQLPANDEEELVNCEDFFLLDGRDPVYLPDTWSEARNDFKDICESEGGSSEQCEVDEEAMFDGSPHDDEPFGAREELCAKLTYYVSSELDQIFPSARRLKSSGGTSSNGKAAASSYTNQNMMGEHYGYSQSALRTTFPKGKANPTYGYAGKVGPVVGGMVVGAGLVGAGAYALLKYNEQTSENCSGSVCQDGTRDFRVNGNDDIVRDDLMQTGFLGDDVGGGVVVTIYDITGDAFQKDEICPPADWEPDDINWTAMSDPELFVSITQMEQVILPTTTTVTPVVQTLVGEASGFRFGANCSVLLALVLWKALACTTT